MKKLHLICNAHLDPIWQWTWDEGISAAISTFKSAADLADEFDYIFCHNESLLYEAIEKYAPDLFERIREHVKSGKWHITGGWYLQPDCLMPAGETLVRQIAVGKKYFMEKFGVEPEVAVNYDSFGHSVGLVQILAKNGYNGYIHWRPIGGEQFDYPSKFYRWVGPDGSFINSANEPNSYGSRLGQVVDKIQPYLDGTAYSLSHGKTPAKADEVDVDFVLWGVGNHGGGPSRKDLREISELAGFGENVIHSTPEQIFVDKDLYIGGEVNRSLVTCMPGCYSSMAKVKQGFRRCENMFYGTEKMLSVMALGGGRVDFNELEVAQKRMLLATFHDILPGSSVEEAEREGLVLVNSAERTLRDFRTQAFLHLCVNEPVAATGEFPVFVFNYMASEVETAIEVEFMLADQNWREDVCFVPHIYDMDGNELVCQQIKEESTLNLDWRKKIVFIAKLKPLAITRFSIRPIETPAFARKSKPVASLLDALAVSKLLSAPAAFEMYNDSGDPWAMSKDELVTLGTDPREFNMMSPEQCGALFGINGSREPVRMVEYGDVYDAVEACYTLDNSNAVVQYKLYKNMPFVDMKVTVEFAEKNKLVRLKLPIPADMAGAVAVGDGPYVWEKKPTSGELVFQKWLGVMRDDGQIYAVINNGVYAGKIEGGYIYLTLLRGVGYCFHPIADRELYPTDRYLPRIDSGRYVYDLRIFRGNVSEVSAMAELFNQLPYAVNVFPVGGKQKPKVDLSVDGNVITSVIHPRNDGGFAMRIYNPADNSEPFTVHYGDGSVSDVASAREVVSVIYSGGSFTVHHDSMPL